MITLVTVRNSFTLMVMLLPLLLVISCKETDTHEQMQTSSKAGASVDTPANKPATAAAENNKQLASTVTSKPTPTPQKQTTTNASSDANTPSETTAGSKPAIEKPTVSTAKKPAAKVAEKPVLPKPKPAVPTFGPDDPRSGIYLSITGQMAGMGDPSQSASDAYRYGQGEHPEALAGAGLPKDKFGLIDWMAIVNEGIIKPVDSLKPGAPAMPPFDMNVLITSKGDFVNDVLFPHKAHTYWLKCENCHTGIFIMAKGKNNMTMQGIVEGKWCGRCHGKVAFPLTDCNRCHQTPKKALEAAGLAVKK